MSSPERRQDWQALARCQNPSHFLPSALVLIFLFIALPRRTSPASSSALISALEALASVLLPPVFQYSAPNPCKLLAIHFVPYPQFIGKCRSQCTASVRHLLLHFPLWASQLHPVDTLALLHRLDLSPLLLLDQTENLDITGLPFHCVAFQGALRFEEFRASAIGLGKGEGLGGLSVAKHHFTFSEPRQGDIHVCHPRIIGVTSPSQYSNPLIG
mmetsp:Transcript_6627/g.13309  ORF Transcript_6627/g.13309 Transcript_6627/m.13309 type:complete len:214 (-) Transcript_6627:707-1348(-)